MERMLFMYVLGNICHKGGSKGSTRYARAMKLVGNYKFPEEPATLKVSLSKVDLASEEGASKEVTVTTNKDTYTYIVEAKMSLGLKQNRMAIS